jgi:hypothetical protein
MQRFNAWALSNFGTLLTILSMVVSITVAASSLRTEIEKLSVRIDMLSPLVEQVHNLQISQAVQDKRLDYIERSAAVRRQ